MLEKFAFGNPDGASVEISDLLKDFISKNIQHPETINTNHYIIVGPKGSGKTIYLRKFREELSKQQDIYTTEIDRDFPMTSQVTNFAEGNSKEDMREVWMAVWELAIIRSLTSYLLEDTEYSADLAKSDLERLEEYRQKLFPKDLCPLLLGAEVKRILYETLNVENFRNYKQRTEWDELTQLLNKVVLKTKKIYFFVDSIDEEYENNPVLWKGVQEGLFSEVIRMQKNNFGGSYVHIYIAMRGEILESLARNSNWVTLYSHPCLKKMIWNHRYAKAFLLQKIEKMDDSYFINQDGSKTIERWLSKQKIIIDRQTRKEIDLTEYILDYTRFLPRDIVIIGNSLAEIKSELDYEPDGDVTELIYKHVQESAKQFGIEMANICANNMRKTMKKFLNPEQSFYTSDQEYETPPGQVLLDLIQQYLSQNMTWDQLIAFQKIFTEKQSENNKVLNILWQNGIVGYTKTGSQGKTEKEFFNGDYKDRNIPNSKTNYILRTCIAVAAGMEEKRYV